MSDTRRANNRKNQVQTMGGLWMLGGWDSESLEVRRGTNEWDSGDDVAPVGVVLAAGQ